MILRNGFLLLLVISTATFVAADFHCTFAASDQPTCDAAKAGDGTSCVWCAVMGFGVCVSDGQAQSMAANVPGANCDGKKPTPHNDDDGTIAPDDDPYWGCMDNANATACHKQTGCAWCSSKAGYGLCVGTDTAANMDAEEFYDCGASAAEEQPSFVAMMTELASRSRVVSKSLRAVPQQMMDDTDYFDTSCLMATARGDTCASVTDKNGQACQSCSVEGYGVCLTQAQASMSSALGFGCGGGDNLQNPLDFSCLMLTLDQSKATCTAATDSTGAACDYCSYFGYDVCLSQEQSGILAQYGLNCGAPEEEAPVKDPMDFSCLAASLEQDEAACTSTSDEAGAACNWCSFYGYNVCISQEQTDIMANMGMDCSGIQAEAVDLDLTCLKVTLDQSSTACTSTMDATGKPCEWCTSHGYGVCLDSELATMVAPYGVTCVAEEEEIEEEEITESLELQGPTELTCLMVSLQQDLTACEATFDSSGEPCEWCSFNGMGMCMTGVQAAIAGQYGAECDGEEQVEDPTDLGCLMASLKQDQSVCEASTDNSGEACTWCSYNGIGVCMSGEQAAMAGEFGVECANEELENPSELTCLMESLEQDQSVCQAAKDSSGVPCEWCSYSGLGVCFTSEQAAIAGQYGAQCSGELEDPTDLGCLMASLKQDQSVCEATMDSSGETCEWCSYSGIGVCMSGEQAAMAGQFGVECGSQNQDSDEVADSIYDFQCLMATLEQSCVDTTDATGVACELCTIQGFQVCVSADQADIAKQSGFATCGEAANEAPHVQLQSFPNDFFECLEMDLDVAGCNKSDKCTWCDSEVGISYCLSNTVASFLGPCSFFSCNTGEEEGGASPLDPMCLSAGVNAKGGDAKTACGNAKDSTGDVCVWCDAAGVFGLCLSAEQAVAAGEWLQCGEEVVAAIA